MEKNNVYKSGQFLGWGDGYGKKGNFLKQSANGTITIADTSISIKQIRPTLSGFDYADLNSYISEDDEVELIFFENNFTDTSQTGEREKRTTISTYKSGRQEKSIEIAKEYKDQDMTDSRLLYIKNYTKKQILAVDSDLFFIKNRVGRDEIDREIFKLRRINLYRMKEEFGESIKLPWKRPSFMVNERYSGFLSYWISLPVGFIASILLVVIKVGFSGVDTDGNNWVQTWIIFLLYLITIMYIRNNLEPKAKSRYYDPYISAIDKLNEDSWPIVFATKKID